MLLKSLKVVTFLELITINQESRRTSIDLDWISGSVDLLTVDLVVDGGCRDEMGGGGGS